MKKYLFLMVAALMSLAATAGENDLLWDYTEAAPSSSPDNGLYFNNKVNDPAGTNNGLKGIKLNSSGYCAFKKAAVAGRLKLSFGPRSGTKETYIEVWNCTWDDKGQPVKGDTKIAVTGKQTEYATQTVELTAEQNDIYLWRGADNGTETALQKIQFKEGQDDTPEECEIIFKDQNGKELGRVQTYEGSVLEAIPYTESDLPAIAEGEAFRGWFYTSGKKAFIGDIIEGNTTIQAKVTPIENATVGSVWRYDFTSPIFYPEDHDLIVVIDGEYVNASKGWEFGENGVIRITTGSAKTVIMLKKNGSEEELRYESMRSVSLDVAGSTVQSLVVYNVLDYVSKDEKTGYFIVPKGDGASFLMALVEANKTGNAKIYLPNGLYDIGQTVLTPVTANGISIIGESMEGTIIRNAPDIRDEGISTTATLLIKKNVKDTYLQDLTLQNALDYYNSGAAGRAVCLQDQGTRTICKNVRLLSYQDTYYSNLQGAVKYFEDCEIHGTVDYICGDGSVYFLRNLLYCEKRISGGVDPVTANNGIESDRGYVFESCTLKSECPLVSFGRAWNNTPTTTFLNTLVDYSAGEFSLVSDEAPRWTKKLMNQNAWPRFGEFNTHLADGTVLTPASNVVTFIDEKSGNATQAIETVLTAEQAAAVTMEATLGDWAATARDDAHQVRKNVSMQDGVMSWNPCEAGVYLVYVHSVPYCITTETSIDLTAIDNEKILDLYELYFGRRDIELTADHYVRFANGRGGFGPAVRSWENPEALDNTACNCQIEKILRDGQVIIVRNGIEYTALGARL